MVNKTFERVSIPLGAGLVACLSGCSKLDVLDPKGSVGMAEKSLISTATMAMLIVVVPVIVMILVFAWRYRASNRNATYAPRWAHSTAIETVVWTVPTLIILFLGILTWNTTHELDPYRPIESAVKPIKVEVVALDWKWLFIYPELGVASVNQLAFPVGTPVDFKITSDSVMNSFFIPQLGSQVYAMSGMQTQLHLIANSEGTYAGRSSAFSGPGFSDMDFNTVVTSRGEFDAWVAHAKASPKALDVAAYDVLQQPSRKNAVTLYSNVAPGLFDGIVYQYMRDASGRPICTTANADMYVKPARLPSHAALVSE